MTQPAQIKYVTPGNLEGGELLAGDAGGFSRITGEVYASNVMPGMHAVETEHGTLYLDSDQEVGFVVED